MNGHNTDSEAHLQGQFWLRGGSPDLREKHTECMYGRALTGTKEQRAPSTQAFHPAHCCGPTAYCYGSLHTPRTRSTCSPGAQVILPRLLSRFPRERAGPGAGAVSGLMSPKGKTDKLCKPLRIPAKAATPLPQIPQPHSPHCKGAGCRAHPSGLFIRGRSL